MQRAINIWWRTVFKLFLVEYVNLTLRQTNKQITKKNQLNVKVWNHVENERKIYMNLLSCKCFVVFILTASSFRNAFTDIFLLNTVNNSFSESYFSVYFSFYLFACLLTTIYLGLLANFRIYFIVSIEKMQKKKNWNEAERTRMKWTTNHTNAFHKNKENIFTSRKFNFQNCVVI